MKTRPNKNPNKINKNTGQKWTEKTHRGKVKQILYLVAHTQIYHCELFPLFFVFITIIFIVPFFLRLNIYIMCVLYIYLYVFELCSLVPNCSHSLSLSLSRFRLGSIFALFMALLFAIILFIVVMPVASYCRAYSHTPMLTLTYSFFLEASEEKQKKTQMNNAHLLGSFSRYSATHTKK